MLEWRTHSFENELELSFMYTYVMQHVIFFLSLKGRIDICILLNSNAKNATFSSILFDITTQQ